MPRTATKRRHPSSASNADRTRRTYPSNVAGASPGRNSVVRRVTRMPASRTRTSRISNSRGRSSSAFPATLTERIPHGTGQTYLRTVLVAVDHTSYHVGQIVAVRRLLGAWST